MAQIIARNPTPGEVEKAAEVASKAFPNLSLEHWQREFHLRADLFGERFILVAECDGHIVSSLICSPQPVYINGSPVSHAAVGAVGTLPEYRCQGCAGVMMKECVRLLQSEEIWLSSLWPFSYEYYRKFGWEVGTESRSYRAPAKVFADLTEPKNVRAATDDDFERIKSIYEIFGSTYNCMTDRSDEWWRKILRFEEPIHMETESGRGVVIHETDNEADGYCVYDIGIQDDKTVIGVRETAFNDPVQRREMLAFIAGINPEADLSFYAPANDTFLLELPNPRAVECRLHPSFQFRIIDPRSALELYTPHEAAMGAISFSISDPVFKHGFEFGVEFEDGEVELCKPNRSAMAEMDINTLAQLFTGYASSFDLVMLDKIKLIGDSANVLLGLFSLFTGAQPYRSGLEPG